MKIKIYCAACLVLICLVLGNKNVMAHEFFVQDNPKPDQWRGLIIDNTTPEEAFNLLGKAEKDKVERLRIFTMTPKWITEKHKEKIYRVIRWSENKGLNSSMSGVKFVQLSFFNNQLVLIEFWLKNGINASSLESFYQIQFEPWVDRMTEFFEGGSSQRMRGNVLPKRFPTVYSLQAATKNSFIGVSINNSGWGGNSSDMNGFPGKAEYFQIVSKQLENRDGVDALK